MKSAKLKLFLHLIGYVLVVVFAIYAIRTLPLEDAIIIFQTNGWTPAIYAFIAFSFAMALRSYRFTSLAVNNADRSFRHRTLIIFPWLFMVSALGPFRIGEGAKIIWLSKERQSLLTSSATLVLERMIDLLTLIFIGIGGLLYLPEMMSTIPSHYLTFLVLLLFLSLVFIVVFISKADALTNLLMANSGKYKILTSISSQLSKIRNGFNSVSNKMQFARLILISLGIWVAMAAGFSFLVRDFFPQVNIFLCGSLVAAVNITAIVSIMPGNVGTFQLSASAILLLAGIEFKDSLTFTILLQVVSLLTVILWGCVSRITLTIWDFTHHQ